MLKRDRWFSVVFQHWNVKYFKAILSSAAESGAELKAAVSQVGDPIWSMHKKKNKDSVLAGELILTFYKTGTYKRIEKQKEFNIAQTIDKILKEINGNRVYGEYLFNRIVIEAWEKSAIETMDLSRSEFSDLLERRGWQYDEANHYWVKGQYRSNLLFDISK